MKKQIFTLLAISFFTIQLTAQSTFQKFITVNGKLQAGDIKKAGDSGFVVTGNYRERERESPEYILLAKLDTRARLQWLRVFGNGIQWLSGETVSICSDGGYAVAGVANESDEYAVFIVKFNYAGDLVWSKKITYTVQGFSSIYSTDITETKNGSLLITGETSSTNAGDEFVLSMKSSSGNVNWLRTIGTINYRETGHSIHITEDGGFVVGGITIPDGGNYLVVKYNNKGIPEWTKTIASKNNASGVMYGIIPTLDNGYAFTGITPAGNLNYNIIAVKLNSNHNIEWSKIIQRSTYDAGNAIIQIQQDSSYFIAGGENLIFHTNGFLLHLNKNGKLLSSRLSVGAGDYANYTALIRDRSSVITAGSSHNKILITKFDDNGNSCNDYDANDTASKNFGVDTVNVEYVSRDITGEVVVENFPLNELNIDAHVRVICASNNNSIAFEKNNVITNDAGSFSFKIYPNPAVNNELNIAINCSKSTHITFGIINTEGKLKLSQSIFIPAGSSTNLINVSSLPQGVYILRASDDKEQKTIKFVKSR